MIHEILNKAQGGLDILNALPVLVKIAASNSSFLTRGLGLVPFYAPGFSTAGNVHQVLADQKASIALRKELVFSTSNTGPICLGIACATELTMKSNLSAQQRTLLVALIACLIESTSRLVEGRADRALPFENDIRLFVPSVLEQYDNYSDIISILSLEISRLGELYSLEAQKKSEVIEERVNRYRKEAELWARVILLAVPDAEIIAVGGKESAIKKGAAAMMILFIFESLKRVEDKSPQRLPMVGNGIFPEGYEKTSDYWKFVDKKLSELYKIWIEGFNYPGLSDFGEILFRAWDFLTNVNPDFLGGFLSTLESKFSATPQLNSRKS